MKNRIIPALLLSAALGLGCERAGEDKRPRDQTAQQQPFPSEPDNRRTNQRDRGEAVTPLDQSESEADLKITQEIRQALMKDDSLSFTAQNVKIITRDGNVILRGTVNSRAEKTAVSAHANKIAGVKNVDDQLEVAGAAEQPSS